jgi:D-beta-D-heptose 7-phosphate kinase/D-beta-D-heptose 1-phosphate adenosyltransferase
MSLINLFLESNYNHRVKIAVVGDAMLDEYVDVKVKRISPEFPIPVMRSDDETSHVKPGGAANVAYQFKNFNVQVDLFAFLDQEAANQIQNNGISVENSLIIDNKIPRKRRFYSDNFPTYRWDIEKSLYGYTEKEIEKLCGELYVQLDHRIDDYDVVVFSDYNKGIFHKFLNTLVGKAKISIVDPKSGDPESWKNCTIFKPNCKEALELSGQKNIEAAGFYFLDKLNCHSVVITQGGDGISVFVDKKMFHIHPTHTLPYVESVIGAGDCAMAFLTMASAHKFDIMSAANMAWQAGAMYVQNRYNKPVSVIDLKNLEDKSDAKIISNLEQHNFAERNYKLVFTNGCFDILHAGHIENLKFSKKQGDKLIVAVNSDKSVAENKPGRPVNKLSDRIKLLSSLEFVDFVVPFDEKTPLEILQKIKPDVLVKGAQYSVEDIVGHDLVSEVITCPMYADMSTTQLINKIKEID